MITFRQETEIKKPLDMVVRLFTDRSFLSRWQPGLLSSEVMEDGPHPKYKLTFQFGRRRMPMTETVLRDEMPQHYEAEYKMKGVYNKVHHSFADTGHGTTRWICDQEFRFKGIMALIVLFMRGDFEKQSAMLMEHFKGFAESNT